jgi:pimeloyl-ACP methyl ester carboxylesterase
MTIWQSIDVQVNSIQLHIARTGGDKPALVLVHGVSDDGLCWSPVAVDLSADYDVIMVDARGHGHSDAPESGYDLLTLANDLHGVIRTLGLNKPLILGHSLGAVTALVMAALYPQISRAILLEDPPAWWVRSPDSEFSQGAGAIRDWALQLKSQTREEIITEGRIQNPLWSEAELAPWADSKVRFSLNAITYLFASNPTAGVDWEESLPRISCPVLALTADPEKGAAMTPEGVEALRALVPQLQAEHIADAGHNIRREQFAHYMEVVRAFLLEILAA